jgi:hypothetical protein
VTFAVYAALSGFLLLFVVHLQVVAGYSPLASGMALCPSRCSWRRCPAGRGRTPPGADRGCS